MQMTDEDVVDFVNWDLIPYQLHLCAFATIDQEMPVLNNEVL